MLDSKIKKMKKLKFVILTIIASIISSSCSDYLDQKPEHQISLDAPIDDNIQLQIRVNGLYHLLQSKYYYGRTTAILPDLMSDNSFIEKNNNIGNYIDFDNYNLSTIDFDVENQWTLMYRTVVSANFIFLNISQNYVPFNDLEDFDSLLPIDTDEANEFKNLIGQTLAMRALAYFDLVKFYAQPYNSTASGSHIGIPVISLEESGQTLAGSTITPSRNTVAEVYTQITIDLDLASRLIGNDNGWSRIDYYAVKALQSRVFLFMEEWEKAELAASEVINNGGFSLVPNDSYVATWNTDFSSESIFSIQFTDFDNIDRDSFTYFYVGTFDSGTTKDFYNAIPKNDVRRSLYSSSSSRALYTVRYKYHPARTRPYRSSFPVLRLSEVYLNRAEARARQDKPLLAMTDLNLIKTRGLAGNSVSGLTGKAVLDQILEERRIELAFEGHRLFDLTRNKQAFLKYKNREEDFPKEILYPNYRTILPIPQEEVDGNQNIIQNPGY